MKKEYFNKAGMKNLCSVLWSTVENDDDYTKIITDRICDDSILDLRQLLFNIVKVEKPKNYLEIGTRKGHSLFSVILAKKDIDVVIIDYWTDGISNIQITRRGLERLNYKGNFQFYEKNSRLVLPYLTEKFDLILVDGDYNPPSMLADVKLAFNLLSNKGIMVVDTNYTKVNLAEYTYQESKDGLFFIRSSLIKESG